MNRIIEFMKRNYLAILFSILLGGVLWSFMPKKDEPNPEKDRSLVELLMYVLRSAHYAPTEINDSLSKQVYTNFLEVTDPNKRFFLQSDIDAFKAYENLIDNEIEAREFNFFQLVYDRLQERTKEVEKVYTDLLSKPFDFSIDEDIETDAENLDFPKDEQERLNRWRKQLKFSVLSSIINKEKEQNKTKEEISEEDADDEGDVNPKKKKTTEKEAPKSFDELEKEARESALKSLNNFFEMFEEITRSEWFAIYLNTILEQYDPHTNYFSPDNKEKFDTSMSGSMEGIGAQLTKKDDYVEISKIIPGGPAWKQNELENGDLILKVAQDGEEAKDIAGLRLDHVVKMIKGKKGTVVHLTVKKLDGSIEVISITRDKFELEETFAKSSVIDTEDGKYGMIYLPKFYEDFENEDGRDAYADVAKEIEELKKDGIKGLIIDLRNNGGGSLRSVVKMVGLFIDEGPVVQVRTPKGNVEVLEDTDPAIQWNGPLVVMINNYSASASEIFAAAIQDYRRGVVVGSKHSFGKGTVQNMIDLNRFVRIKDEDFGALKFTTQKFYRINGESTQLKGVASDIELPDQYSFIETGEKDYKTAMKWDKIKKAKYNALSYNFSPIIEKSKIRIENSKEFSLAKENAQWINAKKDESVFSLNYDKYKEKTDELEKETKKFKALKKFNNNLKFESLPVEVAKFAQDTVLKNKRERWHKSLSKDYYLDEAVKVLEDIANHQ